MIDDLVRARDEEIDTNGRSHIEGIDEPSVEQDPEVEESDNKHVYIVKLEKNSETLATFSDGEQSDLMAEAVNYLVKRSDLIAEIELLPYIPGREKAIFNEEPSSPHDEKAMRVPRALSGG